MNNINDIAVQTPYDPLRYDEQAVYILSKEKDCWHDKFLILHKRTKERQEEDILILDEIDFLIDQIRNLEEINSNLDSKLKKLLMKEEKLKSVENKKFELERSLQQEVDKVSRLEDEVSSLNLKVKELESKKRVLTLENSTLKEQISSSKGEFESEKLDLQSRNEKLENAKIECEIWKSKYHDLSKTLSSSTPSGIDPQILLELEQTKEYLNQKNNEFESLRKSKAELYSQMVRVTNENQKNSEKISELEHTNSQMQRLPHEIKAKDLFIQELQQLISEKENLIIELEESMNLLRTDFESANNKFKLQESNLKAKEEEINSLIQINSEKEIELYSQNLKCSSLAKRNEILTVKLLEQEQNLKIAELQNSENSKNKFEKCFEEGFCQTEEIVESKSTQTPLKDDKEKSVQTLCFEKEIKSKFSQTQENFIEEKLLQENISKFEKKLEDLSSKIQVLKEENRKLKYFAKGNNELLSKLFIKNNEILQEQKNSKFHFETFQIPEFPQIQVSQFELFVKLFIDLISKLKEKLSSEKSKRKKVSKELKYLLESQTTSKISELEKLNAEVLRMKRIISEKEFCFQELMNEHTSFKSTTETTMLSQEKILKKKERKIKLMENENEELILQITNLKEEIHKQENLKKNQDCKISELEDQCCKFQKIANELAETLEVNNELRTSLDSTNFKFNEKSKELLNEIEFLKSEKEDLLARLGEVQAFARENNKESFMELVNQIFENEAFMTNDTFNFEVFFEKNSEEFDSVSEKEIEIVKAIFNSLKTQESSKRLAIFYEKAFKEAFDEKEALLAENKSLLMSLRQNNDSEKVPNGLFRNLLNSKLDSSKDSNPIQIPVEDSFKKKMFEWKEKCIFFAQELERVSMVKATNSSLATKEAAKSLL